MKESNYDKAAVEFKNLLQIMDRLREECPWDRKQTMESLRSHTIEEVFELSEAIIRTDAAEINNELGDLLLHIVFYSKISSENREFEIIDVIRHISEKLIARHPHIFGDVKVNDEEDVKRNWEYLKLKEGRKSVLEGVPRSLTGLIKAYRLQEKAAGVGFDWERDEDVWEKLEEELREWKAALKMGNARQVEEELGDFIFSLVNYSRAMKLNPDDALERTNLKFIRRFQYIEERAAEVGRKINDLSPAEMDDYWEEAKKDEIT